MQAGAGDGAMIPDAAYTEAGAPGERRRRPRSGAPTSSSRSRRPTPANIARMRSGALLIGFLQPLTSAATTRAPRATRGVTAFAMEAIPRISRAQSMDALSSQGNVAGYEAVVLAAENLGRFFPMLMTAAGTIPPAKVLVLGAGVAGLQALATARRLGARHRSATTCAPRSPSRSSRSARSSSTSASRPPARAATRAS